MTSHVLIAVLTHKLYHSIMQMFFYISHPLKQLPSSAYKYCNGFCPRTCVLPILVNGKTGLCIREQDGDERFYLNCFEHCLGSQMMFVIFIHKVTCNAWYFLCDI